MKKSIEQIEKDLEDVIKIQQIEVNSNSDEYMTGLLNGLKLALSLINGEEYIPEKTKEGNIFQKMVRLNKIDAANGTHHCGMFNAFVSAQMTKGGGHVTMGVDRESLMEITLDPEKSALLLIKINREAFEKL